ncbi:MAG: phosphoribosyltransferase [Chitinispirillaceae bacterium]
MVERFENREEAGRVLAGFLEEYAGCSDTLVVGLPRGGVVVAYEIAKALGVDLDVFLVRKLGAPYQPELAIGAIAEGGVKLLNEDVVGFLSLSERDIDRVAEEEYTELKRRQKRFRNGQPAKEIRDKRVIVADDGLATGATMKAAVKGLRVKQPEKIIVAVPVGAPSTVKQLMGMADEVICPNQPENFMAVGMWYEHFEQTTDEEVMDLLQGGPGGRAPE